MNSNLFSLEVVFNDIIFEVQYDYQNNGARLTVISQLYQPKRRLWENFSVDSFFSNPYSDKYHTSAWTVSCRLVFMEMNIDSIEHSFQFKLTSRCLEQTGLDSFVVS